MCVYLSLSTLPDASTPTPPFAVVAGSVMSGDLKEGQEVETLAGKKLKITLAGGAKVNGIKIKKADVKAANGVIHSIDAVILP